MLCTHRGQRRTSDGLTSEPSLKSPFAFSLMDLAAECQFKWDSGGIMVETESNWKAVARGGSGD